MNVLSLEEYGNPNCVKLVKSQQVNVVEGVKYRLEKMYVGFRNGKLGIWNMLTPFDSNILKEKKVIFHIENLLLNCLSHKIEILSDDFMIGLNLFGSISLIDLDAYKVVNNLKSKSLR